MSEERMQRGRGEEEKERNKEKKKEKRKKHKNWEEVRRKYTVSKRRFPLKPKPNKREHGGIGKNRHICRVSGQYSTSLDGLVL